MKGYWYEIRHENCNEMYFREGKILPSIHISPKTSPQANPVAKITVSQVLVPQFLNKIQMHDKLVMLKKFEKNCYSLMM